MRRQVVAIALSRLAAAQQLVPQQPLDAASADSGFTISPWRLNFTSTAPHLFASASHLLQQFGNTIFPNGHAIAACEIAPFTLFYHGRTDGDVPPSPEWLAFDIEMAYGIMGGTPNSNMLTYQTTRPVKALYFDGMSAALMGLGQLDTQMLHIYGNVSGPDDDRGRWRGLLDEYLRARGLCDWLLEADLRGDGWGFEGIIRMNAGFEMIWCNFTSPSLRLLTHVNVTAPVLPQQNSSDTDGGHRRKSTEEEEAGGPASLDVSTTSKYNLPPEPTRTDHSVEPSDPPVPPNWRDWELEPFLDGQSWGWFSSATSRYGSSRNGAGVGEARATILGCGVLSYYFSEYSSLAALRGLEEQHFLNLTADGFWSGRVSDPAFNRTTAMQELSRRRRYHHLENATVEEAVNMRKASEVALRMVLDDRGNTACSGADWTGMTGEIAHETTAHLKKASLMLSLATNTRFHHIDEEDLRAWLHELRGHNHMFHVGFVEYPASSAAADPASWDLDTKRFQDAYSRCRYKYTRLMYPSTSIHLGSSEQELRWAVEETFGTICNVLLTIGFGVEATWAQYFQSGSASSLQETGDTPDRHSLLQRRASGWQNGIEELMAWLGWEHEYTGCSQVCAWDERCYIPMWPLIMWQSHPGPYSPYPRPSHPPPPPRPSSHHPGGKSDRNDNKIINNPRPSRPKRDQTPPWMRDMLEADLWEPKCLNRSTLFPSR